MAPTPRRRLTREEMLARMPRAFRPKMTRDQVLTLGIFHWDNIDTISRGNGNLQTLLDVCESAYTWSRVAELVQRHEEPMAHALNAAADMLARHQRTGSVGFTGPEYQALKAAALCMDDLAETTDQATCRQAADWSERQMLRVVHTHTPGGVGKPAGASHA